MKSKALASTLLVILACPAAAAAGEAAYSEFELQARSNLLVNDQGYNLPPGSTFNSITPAINDSAEVAFPVNLVPEPGGGSHPGVWFGADGSGALVFEGESGANVSSRSPLNNAGEIVFATRFSSNDGLHVYDPVAGSAAPLSTFPLVADYYSGIGISQSGRVGYRAGLASGNAYGVTDAGGTSAYAADVDAEPGSPWFFLYTPALGDDGRIAGKASTSGDYASEEIRLFDAPGSSTLVIANDDADPTSPWAEFDNGLDLNANGVVAVVATRAEDGARVVLRTDGSDSVEIAAENPAGPILEIKYFAPALNDSGWVAFRAVDALGGAIYVGNGEQLIRVVGEGDVVQTDLGVAQIGQHDASPIFAGQPAINAHGDIAFVAGLHPQGDNQVEWGSGVFVAYAPAALDDVIFANGFETQQEADGG